MEKIITAVPILLLIGWLSISGCHPSATSSAKINQDSLKNAEDSALLQQYSPSDLKTNWTKHSIPLDSIHDGGPGKNDIPAIDYPEFVSVNDARQFLTEPDFGILLIINDEQKFYPFNILNWHEIVNDVVGDKPVAVTFCPLCGSAMVYNRMLDGDTLLFGVSGKLYESNQMMFDEKTESLWSQAMGECVVGDYLGKKLQLINSVVASYEEIENYFPHAGILSTKTGFERNYFDYPYSDYNSTDELYFPVSKKSNRFKNKDEMYVVQIGNSSVAFPWKNLLKTGKASQSTPDGTIEVTVEHFIPAAINRETGNPLNGYFSYWFSWYTTYGEKGIVWGK